MNQTEDKEYELKNELTTTAGETSASSKTHLRGLRERKRKKEMPVKQICILEHSKSAAGPIPSKCTSFNFDAHFWWVLVG